MFLGSCPLSPGLRVGEAVPYRVGEGFHTSLKSIIKGGFIMTQPARWCPELWGGEDVGVTGGSHGMNLRAWHGVPVLQLTPVHTCCHSSLKTWVQVLGRGL